MEDIQSEINPEDMLEETTKRKESKKDAKELTADDFSISMCQAIFLTRMGM